MSTEVEKDVEEGRGEGEKPEEMEIEVVEEKLIPLNLRKIWVASRRKRSPKAIRFIRDAVKRHMKVEDVKISNEVNEDVWTRGIQKPPRKITVRAVKDKEGNVIVFPSEKASPKT